MKYYIGISGIGIVGNALVKTFEKKKIQIIQYDKYKGNTDIKELLKCKIIFLCLPTLFSMENKEYDKRAILENCVYLQSNNYKGIIVIKSTVEPGTSRKLATYYNLNILHNPEFLSAKTAVEDFENQTHIVIGGDTKDDNNIKILEKFYRDYWKEADISTCLYEESEMMKISINCFYAVKIQFFNEIYLLSKEFKECEYDNIVNMMIKNKWISKHHTQVPGTDGELSYGGMCFPKDTNALNELMKIKEVPHKVLEGTILERDEMR